MRTHEIIQEKIKKEYEDKGYKVSMEVPIRTDTSFLLHLRQVIESIISPLSHSYISY